MRISHERPKIFDKFERIFGAKWDDGVVIAWDETIFCKNQIPPDVVVHEQVHLEQQKEIGKEKWLKRYLGDADFRLAMEKMAYLTQAALIKKHVKDKNQLYLCIREIAQDFASSTYGGLISFDDALKLLYP